MTQILQNHDRVSPIVAVLCIIQKKYFNMTGNLFQIHRLTFKTSTFMKKSKQIVHNIQSVNRKFMEFYKFLHLCMKGVQIHTLEFGTMKINFISQATFSHN